MIPRPLVPKKTSRAFRHEEEETVFKNMVPQVPPPPASLFPPSYFVGPKTMTLISPFCPIASPLVSSPNELDLVESLGEVQAPRAGMSSQLGVYTRTGGNKYRCSTCDGCDLKDYTGSYHMSISLPRDGDGWVVYDESALDEDGGRCSDTYVRDPEDGRSQLEVWVDAHMVRADVRTTTTATTKSCLCCSVCCSVRCRSVSYSLFVCSIEAGMILP